MADGKVIATRGGGTDVRVEAEIGGARWIAARARAVKLEEEPDIQAHTNPVWINKGHDAEARARVAGRWQAELEYYRGAPLVFPNEETRRQFFDRGEHALRQIAREIIGGKPGGDPAKIDATMPINIPPIPMPPGTPVCKGLMLDDLLAWSPGQLPFDEINRGVITPLRGKASTSSHRGNVSFTSMTWKAGTSSSAMSIRKGCRGSTSTHIHTGRTSSTSSTSSTNTGSECRRHGGSTRRIAMAYRFSARSSLNMPINCSHWWMR